MEFYRIRKKDLKESVKCARRVSTQTGKPFLYHWIDCLKCIVLYGCSPLQYKEGGFFELRSFDRNKTYTKYRSFRIKRLFNNPDFESVLNNKVEFNKHFSKYVGRKWIYCREASQEELTDFLLSNKRIIVKPISLSKGNGIYELDRNKPDEEIVNSFLGKEVLLEECIIQHPLMCFGNKSVNTLRITTLLDSQGEVHIIKPVLRCGVGEAIVDNYCAGGVLYPIHSEYGIIEGPGGNRKSGQVVFVHPGTNIFMIGRDIPYWNEAIDLVTSAAKQIPQLRFVGWDVAITENGPVLIEGNTRPGAVTIKYLGAENGMYRKILSYL